MHYLHIRITFYSLSLCLVRLIHIVRQYATKEKKKKKCSLEWCPNLSILVAPPCGQTQVTPHSGPTQVAPLVTKPKWLPRSTLKFLPYSVLKQSKHSFAAQKMVTMVTSIKPNGAVLQGTSVKFNLC